MALGLIYKNKGAGGLFDSWVLNYQLK